MILTVALDHGLSVTVMTERGVMGFGTPGAMRDWLAGMKRTPGLRVREWPGWPLSAALATADTHPEGK